MHMPEDTALQALIAKHTPLPRKREESNLLERCTRTASFYRTRLMRNTVGRLKDSWGRWITFGLGVGSSDLIGYQVRIITPEMVGQKVAVFTAIEVKKPGRDTTQADHLRRQQAWIDAVVVDGGIGRIVRSEEELIEALKS
jgi:hypothetical protein